MSMRSTCRLCAREAETRVAFEVPWLGRQNPHVEHVTCDLHTLPLMRDMIDAGWVIVERVPA